MANQAPSTVQTLPSLSSHLREGLRTSESVVVEALERARDGAGEGARTFISLCADSALKEARTADDARLQGAPASILTGIPVSIKDLFDIQGTVTLAGSRSRKRAAPAVRDATVVTRLRRAGAVIVGRTNMTEFAFSGLGINPHYGTPLNPYERSQQRIPGGSSSGAAVSVTDGMATVAVGTDTGGSVRIPAAFCGLTGFKPTAARMPMEGVLPLSTSLDSVGVIGRTVECCALVDAVLAGDLEQIPTPPPVRALRLGAVVDYVLDDMDAATARSYEAALRALREAGATIEEVRYPELSALPVINHKGGFAAYESYRQHLPDILEHRDLYDPRVATRIARGAQIDEGDYGLLRAQRASFIELAGSRFASFDALLAPTVPILPPTLADCASDDDYTRLNLLVLRNPSIVNFLDGCAFSLPCHAPGDPPAGLMLFQRSHQDRRLIGVARSVQTTLTQAHAAS